MIMLLDEMLHNMLILTSKQLYIIMLTQLLYMCIIHSVVLALRTICSILYEMSYLVTRLVYVALQQ